MRRRFSKDKCGQPRSSQESELQGAQDGAQRESRENEGEAEAHEDKDWMGDATGYRD